MSDKVSTGAPSPRPVVPGELIRLATAGLGVPAVALYIVIRDYGGRTDDVMLHRTMKVQKFAELYATGWE